MGRRQKCTKGIALKRFKFQFRVVFRDRPGRDRQLQSAVAQAVNNFVSGHVMQQYFDFGNGLLKRRESRRKYFHRRGRRIGDVQFAVLSPRQGLNFFDRFIGALEHIARFFQE